MSLFFSWTHDCPDCHQPRNPRGYQCKKCGSTATPYKARKGGAGPLAWIGVGIGGALYYLIEKMM